MGLHLANIDERNFYMIPTSVLISNPHQCSPITLKASITLIDLTTSLSSIPLHDDSHPLLENRSVTLRRITCTTAARILIPNKATAT